MKPKCVTIQMKAVELYFHVVLFIILYKAISFPEAAILLVSDGDRDLWPGPTPEVRDSGTSRHSVNAQSQE